MKLEKNNVITNIEAIVGTALGKIISSLILTIITHFKLNYLTGLLVYLELFS